MNIRKEIRKTIREQEGKDLTRPVEPSPTPTQDYLEIQNEIESLKNGLDRFMGLLPYDFDTIGADAKEVKKAIWRLQSIVNDMVETVDID